MKNKFASFINTMLVLLPISLVIVSCKKEEEDKQQDNAPSHVEAVDLGLSVKWANCNIGASTPEDAGACYAWGETEEKEVSFFMDEYKLSKKGISILVYVKQYC